MVKVIGQVHYTAFTQMPFLVGRVYGHPKCADGSIQQVRWIERAPALDTVEGIAFVSNSGRQYLLQVLR